MFDKTPLQIATQSESGSKRLFTAVRTVPNSYSKLKPSQRRWFRNILAVFTLLILYILFRASGKHTMNERPDIPMYIISKSEADLNFGFADRETGNLERVDGAAPRSSPLKRKLGLVAIPAGGKAKSRVDELVRAFGLENFSFMIFHWDNSTWNDLPWYKDVVSVRALGQTKFWFAKRFLTPDITINYDYIWLWDDDIRLGPNFDPAEFTQILKSYNIHLAQPSLLIGQHGPQGNVVTHRKVGIGRFTNFVEIMIPIFSTASWTCAWRLIPYDTKATWGVDNAWYPVCGSFGYCRFAVIDKFPVKHMDTKTFTSSLSSNIDELNAYLFPFHQKCREIESQQNVPRHLELFCRIWTMRNPQSAFDTLRSIKPEDEFSDTCPDPTDFPGLANKPFWQLP